MSKVNQMCCEVGFYVTFLQCNIAPLYKHIMLKPLVWEIAIMAYVQGYMLCIMYRIAKVMYNGCPTNANCFALPMVNVNRNLQ